jgi:hypothetical protein
MKPVWKSTTIRATFLSLAFALYPHLQLYLSKGGLNPDEVAAIIGTLLFTWIQLESRHDATEILYTPRGWPGRNPEDARRIEQQRHGE